MRRKKMLIGFGVAAASLTGVALVLGLLVRHEPSFYHRVGLEPGPLRQQNSSAFFRESTQLLNNISGPANPETGSNWHATFTEAQINGFFDEDFLSSGLADKLLPSNISGPRVAIEQDKIRLAFRYGKGFWSTIISAEFCVWMAAKEPNVVLLELQSIHAGALPVAPQPFLEQLSEIIRGPNIDVTWYRHNNHPTAAIQFRSEKDRPNVVLRQLDVRPGVLTIIGRSLDNHPVSLAPARPGLTPAAH